MADMKRIKGRIAETIYPNGQGAITAEAHQALLLEMVDEINSKKQDTIEGGAPFSEQGNYPDLSAGFAENLVGRGESVPAEFTFRASGGKSIKDGAARIKRIKGNSVVWNQKVEKTYVDGDMVLQNIGSIPQGHKFALIRSKAIGGCYYMPIVDIYDYLLSDGEYAKIFVQDYALDAYNRIYCTAESGYVQLIDLTQMFGAGNEPTTIEEYNARKPIVEDEYAYNEGEVIHCNTESIKSIGDNAWDEQWEVGNINLFTGENEESIYKIRSKNYIKILPNTRYFFRKPSGAYVLPYYYDEDKQFIASDDVLYTSEEGNEFTTMNAAYMRFSCTYVNYEIQYNNDLMLTLVHSGWKQDTDAGYQEYWQDTLPLPIIRKYFPDGMKSAGAAHDEIRFNKASGKWEKVMRIGSVDMGSLTWGKEWYNEAEAYRIFADITNKAAGLSNILCCAYTNANVGDGIMADFTITGNTSTNYVYLKDSSYSAEGVDALIDSLQGVMLYYELAEPVIREIDEPIGTDYRVADFGTEQAISSIPSAPFSADIIYQFNAVDMIRELWLKVQELESRLNNGGL